MRCPTCKKMYDDPAIRYCLDDGAPLQPTLPRFDQESPTLAMQKLPTHGVASGFPTRIINPKIVETLYQTLITYDKQPLTLDEIYQLAPRFLNDSDVLASIEILVERKMLKMYADPRHKQAAYYWSFQEEIGQELSEVEKLRLEEIEKRLNEELVKSLDQTPNALGISISSDDIFTPAMRIAFVDKYKGFGWREIIFHEGEGRLTGVQFNV